MNKEATVRGPAGAANGLTRRQVVVGTAIGLGSLAVLAAPARAAGADTSLHQELDFKTSPERVYEALLDEKQFSAFTGGTAEIHREAGGTFRLFGGLQGIKGVTGRNVELIPNQCIVQVWRAEFWPAGVYSVVRFELKAQDGGTRVVLDQASFAPLPPAAAWSKMYWDPLRKYLAS